MSNLFPMKTFVDPDPCALTKNKCPGVPRSLWRVGCSLWPRGWEMWRRMSRDFLMYGELISVKSKILILKELWLHVPTKTMWIKSTGAHPVHWGLRLHPPSPISALTPSAWLNEWANVYLPEHVGRLWWREWNVPGFFQIKYLKNWVCPFLIWAFIAPISSLSPLN